MKKTIAIYSILFFLIFFFHWFFSELYCILTPFLLIYIYPVLLITVIGMMIWAIVILVKRRRAYKWKAAVPFVIAALIITATLFFPFEKAKVYTEFFLYTPQREKVVDMIAKDPSFENPLKRTVSLPMNHRYLSCDGEVHVKKHTENALVIGFWVFRGLSVNGYSMVYYTSTQDESTLRTLIEDDISFITKLNANWYYVVTD